MTEPKFQFLIETEVRKVDDYIFLFESRNIIITIIRVKILFFRLYLENFKTSINLDMKNGQRFDLIRNPHQDNPLFINL